MTHNDRLTDVFKWVQQRPWLLLPVLGLIPLTGAYVHHRYPEAVSLPAATPALSPSVAKLTTPSPLALPSMPQASASPQALKQATPTPTPVDPSKYTKEQAEINARSKATFAASSGTVDSLIQMHVAIAMGVSSAAIASSNGAIITDGQGKTLQQLSSRTPYSIQANGDTLTVATAQLPSMVVVEPTSGSILYLGNKPYRGRFVLAAQGSRIWVVNYVDLRRYLHSVVASEVSPSWNAQALKAQAVAARSYALTYYFKPVNSLYHMGSDEYYQVYSGTEREDDRTSRAVDETAGEFVSYEGGIVESLYAASDSIVIEAFKGKGMSQLGALNLAEQGYDYLQILANYYPKTGVAKIERDHD
ncbi:SpoIID/LytB domain-containing protein [Myxacorys almedinensis]|uniref:SpoIID/LytB domain-containing protein n=1 Tax=Myxacorys almedinensis A TaxID=2690445 RepID=A0A8J7Z8N3_9CYAN|nr:SpoIID/LytB domain-containing protein [Myxacorys almedinensis]NDJ18433.1 SpoIID/LytB domain-containing protein [Myxacorys almedinensis A]